MVSKRRLCHSRKQMWQTPKPRRRQKRSKSYDRSTKRIYLRTGVHPVTCMMDSQRWHCNRIYQRQSIWTRAEITCQGPLCRISRKTVAQAVVIRTWRTLEMSLITSSSSWQLRWTNNWLKSKSFSSCLKRVSSRDSNLTQKGDRPAYRTSGDHS